MATIKEDYCSKDLYRLLIKKGFDGEIHTSYNEEGYTQPCITLQSAIKWLREVHEIHCLPVYRQSDDYEPQIFCLGEWINDDELDGCFSYEEACEALIKYCLENLI